MHHPQLLLGNHFKSYAQGRMPVLNKSVTIISPTTWDTMMQRNKSKLFDALEQLGRKQTIVVAGLPLLKTCRRHTNVVFLKTHKTGSETTSQIFMRFADLNNLSLVLPTSQWPIMGWAGAFTEKHYIHSTHDDKFNIMCLHCIYNRHALDNIMANGTKYVTILREPWSQFKSAFSFFKWAKVVEKKIGNTTTHHLEKFLENPGLFYNGENISTNAYLRNFIAFDLGLPPKQYDDMNAIRQFVNMIANDFDLVMILEYYDESLILLRRLLCWKLEDILYIPNNVRTKVVSIHSYAEQLYHHFSQADYFMYKHFLTIFEQRLKDSQGLRDEVNYFQKINTEYKLFCKQVLINSSLIFEIQRSSWSDGFRLNESHCTKSRLYIPDYMRILKETRYGIKARKNKQKLWPIP
ncbi:galactose-3-O-sulfotransferase 2-like [Saccoglossus kowalevskii]